MSTKAVLILVGAIGILGFAIFASTPRYQTYCTPRTASDPTGRPQQTTDQQVSTTTDQTCYRRAIYGGGSGGVGK